MEKNVSGNQTTSCKASYFHKPHSVIDFTWKPGSGIANAYFFFLLTSEERVACQWLRSDYAQISSMWEVFMLTFVNVFWLIFMLRFSVTSWNSKYFGFTFILHFKLKVTDYTSGNSPVSQVQWVYTLHQTHWEINFHLIVSYLNQKWWFTCHRLALINTIH